MSVNKHKQPGILRDRNLRFLFAGQATSMVGDSFYMLTLLWMTETLTKGSPLSSLWIGIVVGSGYVTRVFVTPVAGVFVDRWRKRTVMLVSDAIRAVVLGILAVLFVLGHAHVLELVVFQIAVAAVTSYFRPANVSLLRQITKEDQLLKANALFRTTQQTTAFLGPALGGFLIGSVGMAPALEFDCLSFIVSVVSLIFVKSDEVRTADKAGGVRKVVEEMGEGFQTLVSVPITRIVFPFMLSYNFMIASADVLLVVFISNVLHYTNSRGAIILGVFQAAMALGDIVGGLSTEFVAKRVAKEHMLAGAMGVSAVFLFLIGLSKSIVFISACLFIISVFIMMSGIVFQTTVQLAIPKNQLGRVWSLVGAALNGSVPLSQVLGSWIAVFVPIGLMFNGMGILAAGVCAAAFSTKFVRHPGTIAAVSSPSQSESVGAP